MELNENHWAALAFTILAWVFGWYGLVLITARLGDEDTFPVKVTPDQYKGLGFSVFIAVLVWLKNIYAIQGDTAQQK